VRAAGARAAGAGGAAAKGRTAGAGGAAAKGRTAGAGGAAATPGEGVTKPRRTQRERREATVGKLVDATIASLLAVGYAKTTVKGVCRRAGLSHGALFRVFSSMLDLVIAAGEEIAGRQIAEFEGRFARSVEGGDPLVLGLGLLREACHSKSNVVFYELLVAARTDRELREALRPAMRRYHDAIRQTAARVPGTEALAPETLEAFLFTVLHTFDGESLARTVLPQPEIEERSMALLVRAMHAAAGQ
jgi:AcrR family transcriptional regulator